MFPPQVLDALMTYMYHGTVSVPHNKLPLFLKTAEALKIKGMSCLVSNFYCYRRWLLLWLWRVLTTMVSGN